jgi:hypothetical protein
LKEEVHESIEELKHLRQLKVKQDVTIKTLNIKVQTLATECTELKQFLSTESEIKSLRKHDVILREHEADIAPNVGKSIKEANEQVYITDVRSTRRLYGDENGSEIISSMHTTSEQFDVSFPINLYIKSSHAKETVGAKKIVVLATIFYC